MTPIEDGFMIHQPDKDRVHYLNHTAALVLELSDGRRAPAEIAALLKQAYKLRKLPQSEVDEALARMTAEGLLEVGPAPSRRGAARGARKPGTRKTSPRKTAGRSQARKAGTRKRRR